MISKLLNFINKNFNLEIKSENPKEAVKFAMVYFKNNPIVAAEIGVFQGRNSYWMNKKLNIKKFFLIDPYERYEDYKRDKIIPALNDAKKKARKRNKKWGKTNLWIEELSDKAYVKIPDNFLDFLYIDGNHEYEYVKKDLELYWNKIKKRGIISGHDIQYSGVSDALIEFVKKRNLQVFFGDRRDWWIIKR
ncbi:class I SAM-dependent methyltransferase [Candidatus Pacearchaeota archaeon]|nr:class I SAM-dependent methyltransferase [Candidatus Pacearchaeota archaeon]